LFALATFLCPPGHAQIRNLVVTQVNPAEHRAMTGIRPQWASAQNDRGGVPANLPLEQLALVLSRSPQQQQAFEQFLSEQQDPASPNFHHWLTPVEVGERFGASQQDIDAIGNWLQSQNLRVDSVANNRVIMWFSGTAADIAKAFGADMHYYLVDGEQRISIAAEPQIPAALAGAIQSVNGLSTLTLHPQNRAGVVQVPVQSLAVGSAGGVTPNFTTSSGNHYLTPADFATIYNVNAGNITGAGQTIAIIGIARVNNQDITNFQALSGLAAKTPTVVIPPNGIDPGPALTAPPASGSVSDGQVEATLDVTRATSIAPGATIDLVISGDTNSGSGLNLAIQHVINTNLAQIMSISFGGCESLNGRGAVNFFDALFSTAAAEGISVFVSSGDSGAAGCVKQFTTPPATQVASPNFICSSSHVTCVGGTQFADTPPNLYWSSTNASGTRESALGYIPEGAWNEPLNGSNQVQVAGTGGGVSAFIPTPSWQTGTGVPGTRQGRYTPDISFSASVHNSYFGCLAASGASCVVQNGGFSFAIFAGTSSSTPDMAGITALLNQQMGSPQGELNTNLYRLAATPGNSVFHDVTVASSGVVPCQVTTPSLCNNSTPSPAGLTGGLSGYLVGAGYDEATGLGSINVANLLANWNPAAVTAATVTASLNPLASGASVTFAATVTTNGATAPTGTVTFFDGATQLGTAALNGSGQATLAISNLTSLGQHSITAVYGGDPANRASTSPALAVTVNAATFTLAANAPASRTISSGQSAAYTLAVTPNGSYTSQISFACSFSPASSGTCTFSPSTITPNASAAATTLTITGAQAALKFTGKNRDTHRTNPLYGFWFVLEAAGLLLLLAGNKFRLQRLTQFSLGGALLVMLAMAGCGASGGAAPNSGKTYQVTVTASAPASGSSAGVSQTQIVSLTVQ
jgi:subtilase family serine protease